MGPLAFLRLAALVGSCVLSLFACSRAYAAPPDPAQYDTQPWLWEFTGGGTCGYTSSRTDAALCYITRLYGEGWTLQTCDAYPSTVCYAQKPGNSDRYVHLLKRPPEPPAGWTLWTSAPASEAEQVFVRAKSACTAGQVSSWDFYIGSALASVADPGLADLDPLILRTEGQTVCVPAGCLYAITSALPTNVYKEVGRTVAGRDPVYATYTTENTGAPCTPPPPDPDPGTGDGGDGTGDGTGDGDGSGGGDEGDGDGDGGDGDGTGDGTGDGDGSGGDGDGTGGGTGGGSGGGTDPNDEPTLCESLAGSFICEKLGLAGDATPVSNTNLGVSVVTPVGGFGPSTLDCPPPTVVNTSFGTMEWSWDYFCDFADGVRPIIIALAWLSAGIGLFSFVRR